MADSLNRINQRIARRVSPLVELVRGAGYHYFVYDNRDTNDGVAVYETRSVMIWTTAQLTPAQWLEEAQAFADAMEVVVSERLAIKAEIRKAQAYDTLIDELQTGDLVQHNWELAFSPPFPSEENI